MIDLDALVRDVRHIDYPPDHVTLDKTDLFALVDEIKNLREQVRARTESLTVSSTATKHASEPNLYRHRLDATRLVRLLTYNLITQKYHVEFYNGDGSPCHLNGYIDYTEMQMMYDLQEVVTPKPHFMERT